MSAPLAAPFSRLGVLGLLLVGFGAFLAMLYFIGVGDTGADDGNNGRAHAAAKGLNGYSALVDLVEADGYDVTVSREQKGLETNGILVLTPPRNMQPDTLETILEAREYRGPTLVILPKWNALPRRFLQQVEDPESVQDGWVLLGGAGSPRWAYEESGPLALDLRPRGASEAEEGADESEPAAPGFVTRGDIRGLAGPLPSASGLAAYPKEPHTPLVVDREGETIVVGYASSRDADEEIVPNWIVFVIEPDLVNNWGLADPRRAMAALSIIRSLGGGFADRVVFDLTTNGLGGTLNLLTFAFQPPFLAATLCLLLAMIILAWRAFYRFGPPLAPPRDTVFGKTQLVTNGADLIVRANRVALLARPYAALSARRMAGRLGLANPRPDAIDASLEALEPGSPSFSRRAEDLSAARRPDAIVSAARALYSQSSRTTRGTRGNPQE